MKFGLREGIWVILLLLMLILFFFNVINNSKSSKWTFMYVNKKQTIIYSAWGRKEWERGERQRQTQREFYFVLTKKEDRFTIILLLPLHLHIYVSLVNTATLYCGIWQDGRQFVLFSHCLVIFNETQGKSPLRCFVALLLLSAWSFHGPLLDGQRQ